MREPECLACGSPAEWSFVKNGHTLHACSLPCIQWLESDQRDGQNKTIDETS